MSTWVSICVLNGEKREGNKGLFHQAHHCCPPCVQFTRAWAWSIQAASIWRTPQQSYTYIHGAWSPEVDTVVRSTVRRHTHKSTKHRASAWLQRRLSRVRLISCVNAVSGASLHASILLHIFKAPPPGSKLLGCFLCLLDSPMPCVGSRGAHMLHGDEKQRQRQLRC